MKRLSALILASSLITGVATAGSTAIGHVTLRVRSEPNGYSVMDVASFLSDPAYLGSVDPAAISEDGLDSSAQIPEGFCTVRARVAGGEILTIEARAQQPEIVQGVIERLVSNLQSIEPTPRTMAREQLEVARQELERASTRFESSRQRLREFIQKNGAVDPGIWRQTVQQSLMQKTGQLENAEIGLAGERALREYLLEVIARESELIEEPVSIGEQELAAYAELPLLAVELDRLKKKYKEHHPKVTQMKRTIAELSEQLQEKIGRKSVRKNPRRVDLEHDLFKVERELALDENRQLVLAQSVQRLRDEARRYALLDSDWRELSQQNQAAEQALRQARGGHENAMRISAQHLVGEWIQVVAGPQISTR